MKNFKNTHILLLPLILTFIVSCGDNNSNESNITNVSSSSSTSLSSISSSESSFSSEDTSSISSSSSSEEIKSFVLETIDKNVTLYYGNSVKFDSKELVGEWYFSGDVPYKTDWKEWKFSGDGNISYIDRKNGSISIWKYGVTEDQRTIYIDTGFGEMSAVINLNSNDINSCSSIVPYQTHTHFCKKNDNINSLTYSEANTTNFDTNNSGNPTIEVHGFNGDMELYMGSNSMIGTSILSGNWSFTGEDNKGSFGDLFTDNGYIRASGLGIESIYSPYGINESGTVLFYFDINNYQLNYIKIIDSISTDCYTAESYNEVLLYPNNIGTFCKVFEKNL